MFKKYLLVFSIVMFSISSFAQESGGTSTTVYSFKRGTAIVFFSAVGGAILGLSTLSFYGEPREHTGNITLGAALGLAAGAGYLVWESSQPPPKSSWSVSARGDSLGGVYTYTF